jgi:uncharacterized protein YacL
MLDIIQTAVIIIIGLLVAIKELPKKISKSSKERLVLLDSCALIDGRIIELAKAGFAPGQLAVPEFIVAELQLLADGNDSHKRERARFGLEVVQQLQGESNVSLHIERQHIEAKTTDEKLVKLAKKIGADLFTTDFNLNQVASIEGVRVLNINELAHALRPVALPGDSFEVKVLQVGQNRDQGVGYLEDGTMIVIDNARKDIGKKVRVHVTRTHQTIAGKMLFAQKVDRVAEHQPYRDSAPKDNFHKTPNQHQRTNSQYEQPTNNSRVTPAERSLLKTIEDSH